jgi:hypothetical protein
MGTYITYNIPYLITEMMEDGGLDGARGMEDEDER